MKKILLAGYGWFASIPEGQTNNAELIARALDKTILRAENGEEAEIVSLIVPVIWKEAFAPVEAAIRDIKPDLVLALGTDARACAMRPEPYGVNWKRGKDAARDGSVTDMDEASFAEFIKDFPEIEVEELWVTGDVRPERSAEKWLNLILRKCP